MRCILNIESKLQLQLQSSDKKTQLVTTFHRPSLAIDNKQLTTKDRAKKVQPIKSKPTIEPNSLEKG